MKTNVAINGFGPIGRTLMRQILRTNSELNIVAINDLGDPETLAHLLAFDSVHGRLDAPVKVNNGKLHIGDRQVELLSEPSVEKLPWQQLGVDIVIECTGIFRSREKAGLHLKAGAKKVVISAPGVDIDNTICLGINDDSYDAQTQHLVSNASCTTNCLAPMAKVLHDTFGIVSGLMTTVHSYTNDQRILDLPHSDLHRARAAAANMIPTSTGAAKAIGLVIPELAGKLHGISVRVPTPNVSLVDFVAQVGQTATVDQINAAFKSASEGELNGVMDYNTLPLVSSDFNGSPFSCTFDATQTSVLEGKLVKILGWYDNETGYSTRLMELTEKIAKEGVN